MDLWIATRSQYLTRRFSLSSFLRLWTFHRLTKGIEGNTIYTKKNEEDTFFTRASIHINTFRVHRIMCNCCMVFMTFVSLSFRLKLVFCAQNVPHIPKSFQSTGMMSPDQQISVACTTQHIDFFFHRLSLCLTFCWILHFLCMLLKHAAIILFFFYSFRISYHFTKQYFDESNSHKRIKRAQLLVVRFTLDLKGKQRFGVLHWLCCARDSKCWMLNWPSDCDWGVEIAISI